MFDTAGSSGVNRRATTGEWESGLKEKQDTESNIPQSSWRGQVWFIVLATCIVLTLLLSVAIFFHLRSGTPSHGIVAQTGPKLPPTIRGTVCVLDVDETTPSHDYHAFIPPTVCRYVILCCSRPTRDDTDTAYFPLLLANAYIRLNFRDVTTFLGLRTQDRFDPDDKLMLTLVNNAQAADEFCTKTMDVAVRFDFGGVFFYVPDVVLLAEKKDQEKIQGFFNRLGESAHQHGFAVIVGLPNDIHAQRSLFDENIFHNNTLVMKTTHKLAITPNRITCAAPYNDSVNPENSLSGVMDIWKKQNYRLWNEVKPRLFFSLSLAGYKFQLDPNYPHNVTFKTEIPFGNICFKCGQFMRKLWRHYVDPTLDCFVSITDDEVRTSMSTYGSKFVGQNSDIGGFVIFGLTMDDFSGKCAPKHVLLHMLYCSYHGWETVFCRNWFDGLFKGFQNM